MAVIERPLGGHVSGRRCHLDSVPQRGATASGANAPRTAFSRTATQTARPGYLRSPWSLGGAVVGRPARRLTGVVGVLAAALVFVGLPSAAAAQQTRPAIPAATKSVGTPDTKPEVTASPLSAKAAVAAVAEVDAPRPTVRSSVAQAQLLPRGTRAAAGGAALSAQVTGLTATADPLMASVTLSWTAPANPDSAITGYQLTRSGSDDYAQVSASTTRYTWTGLTFGTSYTFTVTPLSAGGLGTASSASVVTSTGIVVRVLPGSSRRPGIRCRRPRWSPGPRRRAPAVVPCRATRSTSTEPSTTTTPRRRPGSSSRVSRPA